jgi:hypothetical protein
VTLWFATADPAATRSFSPLPRLQANWRVGLTAQQSVSWSVQVTFDHFITGSAATFLARQQYLATVPRPSNVQINATTCTAARTFNRTAEAWQRSLITRSATMSVRYKVSVRAESALGAGPWFVAAAAYLPITMPFANTSTLHLDARSLPIGPVTAWNDLTLNSNHFVQPIAANQPTVSIDPATQSPAVVFTGGQYLQSMSMDFDVDLNNAARRAMTVFVVYKPSSSTSSSAIVGKGAAWCVCELVAGATGAVGGRTAHAHAAPQRERRYYRGGGWAMHAQESNPWNGAQWLTGSKVLGSGSFLSALNMTKARSGGAFWRTCAHHLPPTLSPTAWLMRSTTAWGKLSAGRRAPATRT